MEDFAGCVLELPLDPLMQEFGRFIKVSIKASWYG